MSQCDRILELLQDGRPHEMRDIHRTVGFCRLNSRVAELRARGHLITCEKGHGLYVYRLHAALTEPSLVMQPAAPASSESGQAIGSGGLGSVSANEQLTLVAA